MTEVVRTKYCNDLVSKIAEFRSNDEFCDINIKVDGKVFKCHKLVLCAASEYFYKMFNGTFNESFTKEVTLQGFEANVFEEILGFMYTGRAVVLNSSNTYDMIRAADFYNLPLAIEFCTIFVKEHLNDLAEDILNIYSLAHSIGLTELVDLLSRHIHENFYYFSIRPEFSQLTFDSFIEIINLIEAERRMVAQDVFLEGIRTWITHQENLTVKERESYLERLMKKINFAHLSVEYTRYRTERCMKEVLSGRSIIDGDLDTCNAVWRPAKSLHAYVERQYRRNGRSLYDGTSIFTLYLNGSFNKTSKYKWVYSGELGFRIKFMRNVHVDDRLYSLRYYSWQNGRKQTFQSGSSISMYPFMTLKPPPRLCNEYEMCGMLNDIYVYDKDLSQTSNDTESVVGFSQEEFSHGMYVYKRDIDRWLPIPRPKTRFNYACMTCDDEVVYLIGGTNSNKFAQVYDPRTRGWSTISPTAGVYEEAACCAYGKKIYVVGGDYNASLVEMYDPISGRWQRLMDLDESSVMYDNHRLVNWHSQIEDTNGIIIFPRYTELTADENEIMCLNPVVNDNWFLMPNLFDVVSNTKFEFTDLFIRDVVNF